MRKQVSYYFLVLVFFAQISCLKAFSAAKVPLNVKVNGSLVITNAANDTVEGKNPNIDVNLQVTPDIGAAIVEGEANFRIRTNHNNWRLTAQKTKSVDDMTGLTDTDIVLNLKTLAGESANPNSGALLAPFNAETNLSTIPDANSVDVVKGNAKTSKNKDGLNKNNYFQVNTKYGVYPDFFYSPGTFSTTITYNLVSP